MARRKNIDSRLDDAQAAHADALRQISELETARNAALLSDDDSAAIKLDAQLETLRRTERARRDKVRLLEVEAAKAEKKRRVQERLGLIERIEKTLAERDAIGRLWQATFLEAERQFRELVRLSEAAAAAWPWPPSDLLPMHLSGATIARAITHEIYRVGARPFLGGRAGEKVEASFPGGVCPHHQLMGMPDQITPLGDVLAEASRHASRVMRDGTVDATSVPSSIPPPTGNERSAAQIRLGQLLRDQALLAEDVSPEGETKYQAVVAEITALSGEIEAARAVPGATS